MRTEFVANHIGSVSQALSVLHRTPTTGKQVYYCISAYYDGSHDTSKNVKVVVSEDMNMETKKMTLKVHLHVAEACAPY